MKLYLEQGVKEGLVRSDINLEWTAVVFASIHSEVVRNFEEIEAYTKNMHQLIFTTMDIFVRGILSEDGLKLYNQ